MIISHHFPFYYFQNVYVLMFYGERDHMWTQIYAKAKSIFISHCVRLNQISKHVSEEVSEKDSTCLLAKHYLQRGLVWYDCNQANHGGDKEKKMEMDWTCSSSPTNCYSQSSAPLDSRWSKRKRKTKRDLEENSGDRDETTGMDLGIFGESCPRQK